MTSTDRNPTARVQTVADWLVGGAKGASLPQDVVRMLGERLMACGVPLDRIAVFVTTPHPNVMGRSFTWRPGAEVEIDEAPYAILDSEEYRASPNPVVIRTAQELRRRIEDPACPGDFGILAELRAEGMTDYFVQPLNFTTGEVHVVSWATRQPGGFGAADIEALQAIRPALSRIAEVFALRRTARNILDAYLGKYSGERVLKGLIRLGDGERINAVIWFCDLRGSTPLAESRTPEEFLNLLNKYFACTAGAVLAHGGEVLRFIGDAVLAIFPIAADGAAASRTALAAAQDAIGRMAALNERRQGRGDSRLEFGIGLHVGEVLYGNIGVPERIEFTVIGQAANEAARIESLCKTLGVPLVLSADFVRALPGPWISLGRHALRGVGEPQEVFTLPSH